MKDRIKEVRKLLGLSQEEFADKINLSRNFLWMLEKGEREASERTIKDICREFNVSYEWLTEGTGEMFVPRSRETEIAEMVTRIMTGESETVRTAFAKVLAEMTEAQLISLYDVARNLVDKMDE